MIQGWKKYQATLPRPRRHLSVIKSCDLEPLQQPEYTARFERVQTAAMVIVICIAAALLFAVACWLVGGV